MILHFAQACTKKESDAFVYRSFKKANVKPIIYRTSDSQASLRWIEAKLSDQNESVVIFVHGAPGSADAFYNYLKDTTLLKDHILVSVDRLGYGASERGNAEPSIVAQSDAVKEVLNHYLSTDKRICLVGHSYGGPVIAKLAMDFGKKISGLLFLAPAIDPENEKVFWITKFGKTPPTSWITPGPFKVATQEKIYHVQALQEIESSWNKIDTRVTYMHGTKDMIVPFENMAFAKRKLAHINVKWISIEGENHFIPWKQYDAVVREIQLLTQTSNN